MNVNHLLFVALDFVEDQLDQCLSSCIMLEDKLLREGCLSQGFGEVSEDCKRIQFHLNEIKRKRMLYFSLHEFIQNMIVKDELDLSLNNEEKYSVDDLHKYLIRQEKYEYCDLIYEHLE